MHDGYIDTHPALADYEFTPLIPMRAGNITLPYSVYSVLPALIDSSEAASVLILKTLETADVDMCRSPPAYRIKPKPAVNSLVQPSP